MMYRTKGGMQSSKKKKEGVKNHPLKKKTPYKREQFRIVWDEEGSEESYGKTVA